MQVYTSGGRVFEYDIEGPDATGRAREHGQSIITNGYRSSRGEGRITFYPPHKIDKVVAEGEELVTSYPDRERGT